MKKPIYNITRSDSMFQLQLFDNYKNIVLTSKTFNTYQECSVFFDTLRVQMRFQTNFFRSKSKDGLFGFEIRTCWDELIASSSWFATRDERASAMQKTFDTNRMAILSNSYFAVESDMHETLAA